MLINYLLSLAIIDRAEFVKQHGLYLAFHKDGRYLQKLYYLFDHYIEIRFDSQEDMKVESIDIFKDTKKLHPYLSNINIAF
ncbi:hypothetical protein WJR50_19490 [Catalinimonas sp. 4WD22]|uniref:hypothetical protein n=1 Tax=Catalinimonas locisalis TaxID=3133978 RepID=UPI003100BD9A